MRVNIDDLKMQELTALAGELDDILPKTLNNRQLGCLAFIIEEISKKNSSNWQTEISEFRAEILKTKSRRKVEDVLWIVSQKAFDVYERFLGNLSKAPGIDKELILAKIGLVESFRGLALTLHNSNSECGFGVVAEEYFPAFLKKQ